MDTWYASRPNMMNCPKRTEKRISMHSSLCSYLGSARTYLGHSVGWKVRAMEEKGEKRQVPLWRMEV